MITITKNLRRKNSLKAETKRELQDIQEEETLSFEMIPHLKAKEGGNMMKVI
jgi:hypothetical protein